MSWPMTNKAEAKRLARKVMEALQNEKTGRSIAETLLSYQDLSEKRKEIGRHFPGFQTDEQLQSLEEYIARVIKEELELIEKLSRESGMSGI